jgi:hypothetical protein
MRSYVRERSASGGVTSGFTRTEEFKAPGDPATRRRKSMRVKSGVKAGGSTATILDLQ